MMINVPCSCWPAALCLAAAAMMLVGPPVELHCSPASPLEASSNSRGGSTRQARSHSRQRCNLTLAGRCWATTV